MEKYRDWKTPCRKCFGGLGCHLNTEEVKGSRCELIPESVLDAEGLRIGEGVAHQLRALLVGPIESGNDSGAVLLEADFLEADLSQAAITDGLVARSRFFKADLNGFDGRGSNFSLSNMREIDGFRADFRGAVLRGVDFRRADLQQADFRGADLRGADFRGADLRGANFCNSTGGFDSRATSTRGARCL